MAKEKPAMNWDEDSQQWVRNEAYNCKIFLEAFDNHVILDVPITFRSNGQKIKARAESVGKWGTNLQWPSHLRNPRRPLIADIIQAKSGEFYRYFRGSIRDPNTKEILG